MPERVPGDLLPEELKRQPSGAVPADMLPDELKAATGAIPVPPELLPDNLQFDPSDAARVAQSVQGAEFTPEQMSLVPGEFPDMDASGVTGQFIPAKDAPPPPGIPPAQRRAAEIAAMRPEFDVGVRTAPVAGAQMPPQTMPRESVLRAPTSQEQEFIDRRREGVIRPYSKEDLSLPRRTARTVGSTVAQRGAGAGQALQMAGKGYEKLGVDSLASLMKSAGTELNSASVEAVKRLSYENPGAYDKVVGAFTSGATFFIPGLGISAVAKGLQFAPAIATAFGVSASTVMESSIEAGLARQDALDSGLNEDAADRIARQVFVSNLPITAIGNKLGLFAKSNTTMGKVARGILGEGPQEGAQTMASNIAAGKKPMEDVAESSALGAVVGGTLGPLHGVEPEAPPPAPAAKTAPKGPPLTLKERLARERAAKSGAITPSELELGRKEIPVPAEMLPEQIKSGVEPTQPSVPPTPAAPITVTPEVPNAERGGARPVEAAAPQEGGPQEQGGAEIPIRRPEEVGVAATSGAPIAQEPEPNVPTVLSGEEIAEITSRGNAIMAEEGGYTPEMNALMRRIESGLGKSGESTYDLTPAENRALQQVWDVISKEADAQPVPPEMMPEGVASPGNQAWAMTRAEYGVPQRPTEPQIPKPRSIKQTFGTTGPTPEQLADYNSKVKAYNKSRREYLRAHREYVAKSNEHINAVQSALNAGEAVPQNVIDEYPGLAPQKQPEAPLKRLASAPPGRSALKQRALREIEAREAAEKWTPQKQQPRQSASIDQRKAAEIGANWAKDGSVMASLNLYHLISMTERLTGMIPKVMEFIGKKGEKFSAAGRAYVGGKKVGRTEIWARLAENLTTAKAVMAHEIGHICDALFGERAPSIHRGGLLGRIGSFWSYTKKAIKDSVVTREVMTEEMGKIRDAVKAQAWKDAGEEGLKGKARMDRRKELYKQRITQALNDAGYVTEEQLREDLLPAVQWWNNETGGVMVKTSAELYADAFSMLLNCPEQLAARAPLYWNLLQTWMETKPDFVNAYELMMLELQQPVETQEDQLEMKLMEGMLRGNAIAAQKDAHIVEQEGKTKISWGNLIWRLSELKSLATRHGIAVEDSPIPAIEKLKGAASVGRDYLDVLRIGIDQVLMRDQKVKHAQWIKYLFYHRVINDRAKVFNTLGITPEVATRRLEKLRREVGEDGWALLDQLHTVFNEARKAKILPLLRGVMSDKMVDYLEKNDYYVTFKTVTAMTSEDWDGPSSEFSKGIHAQVGTFQQVRDVYAATIENDLKLVHIALKSKAVKNMVEFLTQYEPEAVIPAKRIAKGIFEKPTKRGYTTLYYLENGHPKAAHVKDIYATAFNSNSQDLGDAYRIIKMAEKWLGINFAKTLFVDINPGFWPWNMLRDSFNTANNLEAYAPIIGVAESLFRTIQNFIPVYRHLSGKQLDERVSWLLREGVLHSAYERDVDTDITGSERYFKRYNLELRKEKFRNWQEAGAYYFELWRDIGRAADAASKVAALDKLRETYPNAKPEWLAYVVKNRTGTPNTANAGKAAPFYNFMFLYSHIAMMGFRGSYESYKANPAMFGSKLLIHGVLPRVLMMSLVKGAWGSDDKDSPLYDLHRWAKSISEYDAASYICLPFPDMDHLKETGELRFFDSNGNAIYFRVPNDEVTRLVGGASYVAMSAFTKEEMKPWEKLLDAAIASVDYTGGQAPGLSPGLRIALSNLPDMAAGRAPLDGLGHPMIDQRVVDWGTYTTGKFTGERSFNWTGLEQYLKSASQLYGLGGYYRMDGPQKPEHIKSWTESIVTNPLMLSNVIGRWIKVGDSGRYQRAYDAKYEAMKSEAKANTEVHFYMENWWNEYVRQHNDVPSPQEIKRFVMGDVARNMPQAKGKDWGALRKQFYSAIAPGLNERGFRILNSGTNFAKVKALAEISEAKSPEEFEAFLKRSRLDRYLGRDAIKLWRRQQQEKQRRQQR